MTDHQSFTWQDHEAVCDCGQRFSSRRHWEDHASRMYAKANSSFSRRFMPARMPEGPARLDGA